MRLRSITVGQQQAVPVRREAVRRAGGLAQKGKAAFEQAGYEVQTLRLATQPISALLARRPAQDALALASALEDEVAAAGIDYCSLGPVLAAHPPEAPQAGAAGALIEQIPVVLKGTQRVFLSVMAATTRGGISLAAIRQAAEALVQAARGDAEGGRPRRFTLSANVPPNGPFFPSAYHRGRSDGFSLAVEGADLAVEAFTEARTLEQARDGLRKRLLEHGHTLRRIAEGLAAEHGVEFHGMDISLAPFPEEARSIAGAMERLGVGRFGTAGTLFATSLITGLLAETALPKCGFSGLMIPLLEDSVMAQRHREGAFTLDSLLLYSAVCGAGLDTIPVPGDATAEQIASVYLDVCALAVALDKPLTCRLMPLPGKRARDPVSFAFRYFAPTTVVDLRGPGSGALLRKADWVGRVGRRGRR